MSSNVSQIQVRKTHGLAIASLVLSILGFTFLPVLGSIFGIITGKLALKEIQAAPQMYNGEGLARAGIVIGWIVIGLAIILGILTLIAVTFLTPIFVG
ncbi:MAG: DUF4190 domain-containing protein [Anaerolineales bacterium]